MITEGAVRQEKALAECSLQMKKIGEVLRLLADGASILALVFLIGFVVHRYLKSNESVVPTNSKLLRGSHFILPGIDWTDAHLSLVLLLSVHCKYCSASSEFYRHLLDLNSGRYFRPVAVFPEAQKAGLRIPSLGAA